LAKFPKQQTRKLHPMAKEEHYHTKFECDNSYHVYNRSVDLKPMFKNRGNYLFFLKRYGDFLSEVVDTYAYNLLGNHFHLCIRIKSEEEINKFKAENKVYKDKEVHLIISAQFKRLFQSYSLAFNKQHQRIGTLFQKPFKRALIDNQKYLLNTITYIHQNAQHHGLVDDFRDWEWSSYNSLLGDKETKLKRIETLKLFGSLDAFNDSNNQLVNGKEFLELEL